MKKLRKWLVSKIAPKTLIIVYVDELKQKEGTLVFNYKIEDNRVYFTG